MATSKTAFPSDQADKLLLRLPDGMRDRIAREAFDNGRTMTKEVVIRLQASLDNAPAVLPPQVEQAIEAEQRERGGTRDEALTRLVLTGQAQGGTVVNLRVGPGTSIPKLHAILEVTMKSLAPDAKSVVTLDATQPG